MKMMTCVGCALAGACNRETFLRSSLKGHGLLSVKFRCTYRRDIFAPGQAAIFTTYVSDEDEDYRGGRIEVVYPGVVIKQMRGKVLGFIKPGTMDTHGEWAFEAKQNGYVKMPLMRVKVDASRPPVEIKACPWCTSYNALDGRCDRDAGHTPPSGCLAQGSVEVAP